RQIRPGGEILAEPDPTAAGLSHTVLREPGSYWPPRVRQRYSGRHRVPIATGDTLALTSSRADAVVPPLATDTYATLAAPVDFLRLLWEASITGSGGFYLNYATATGTSLPAATFATGADGQLTVIALVGDPSNPDRALHQHTTGAVVGYN